MSLQNCHIIDLPKILEPRGNLTFIEANQHVPFPIQRVYYLYDVPGGAERGGHAQVFKNEEEMLQAMTTLIENPELRRTMGLCARRRFEQDYAVEVNGNRLAGIIQGQ